MTKLAKITKNTSDSAYFAALYESEIKEMLTYEK